MIIESYHGFGDIHFSLSMISGIVGGLGCGHDWAALVKGLDFQLLPSLRQRCCRFEQFR
jgi:hypothetical protein